MKFTEWLNENEESKEINEGNVMADAEEISKLIHYIPKSKCALKNISPSTQYIKELVQSINDGVTVISVDDKGKRKVQNLPK